MISSPGCCTRVIGSDWACNQRWLMLDSSGSPRSQSDCWLPDLYPLVSPDWGLSVKIFPHSHELIWITWAGVCKKSHLFSVIFISKWHPLFHRLLLFWWIECHMKVYLTGLEALLSIKVSNDVKKFRNFVHYLVLHDFVLQLRASDTSLKVPHFIVDLPAIDHGGKRVMASPHPVK